MMQTRRRTVVYWPSNRRRSVTRLNVEQVSLACVDEAEETEFERTKVKYSDDLFSSIIDFCEPNNNLLNERQTTDFELDSSIKNVPNFVFKKRIEGTERDGNIADRNTGDCNLSRNDHGIVLFPENNITTNSVVWSDDKQGVTDKFECQILVEDDESHSRVPATCVDHKLPTNSGVDSDQATFNLANLRDSLPRLVITAPEHLHDEVTGAFTLYSGVDTPHASLWSARLNFACTTSTTHHHAEDAESLDTSCCSMDSVVTASSIDSGPRTFYDPALHRPLHFNGAIVMPVCSGADVVKKESSQSPISMHSHYEQESMVFMEHSGNTVSKLSSVPSVNIHYNSNHSVRKPPNAVGRAVTKLTFSPHKSDSESNMLRENVQKRDWRSLYSSSPCNIKRSCKRSTTPKFGPVSLSASHLSSHRTVNPVLKDHRPDVGKCVTTATGGHLSECKAQRGPGLLRTSPRRVPPRYSACRELATAWDCRMLQRTVERDCRAVISQKQDSTSVPEKRSIMSAVMASPSEKRCPLAPAVDNIPCQQHVDTTTLLDCNDKQLQTITMVSTLRNSQSCQQPALNVLRPATRKRQPDRLNLCPPNVNTAKVPVPEVRRVNKSSLARTPHSSPVHHVHHKRSEVLPCAFPPVKQIRDTKCSQPDVHA